MSLLSRQQAPVVTLEGPAIYVCPCGNGQINVPDDADRMVLYANVFCGSCGMDFVPDLWRVE